MNTQMVSKSSLLMDFYLLLLNTAGEMRQMMEESILLLK